MDKLEQAMQSEDFWVELADTSFGTVILHGKNTDNDWRMTNANRY